MPWRVVGKGVGGKLLSSLWVCDSCGEGHRVCPLGLGSRELGCSIRKSEPHLFFLTCAGGTCGSGGIYCHERGWLGRERGRRLLPSLWLQGFGEKGQNVSPGLGARELGFLVGASGP